MTHSELKYEIQKAIDHVPDTVLEEILGYLKQLQATSAEGIELSKNLKRILSEDKELLEKLAQ
jgi:hypothetical protein